MQQPAWGGVSPFFSRREAAFERFIYQRRLSAYFAGTVSNDEALNNYANSGATVSSSNFLMALMSGWRAQ